MLLHFVIRLCHFLDFIVKQLSKIDWSISEFMTRTVQQEAHGPRLAHLSDIATADIQMLCNIFPILSSQLMKRSSFEQFLGLKKNTRDVRNELLIVL